MSLRSTRHAQAKRREAGGRPQEREALGFDFPREAPAATLPGLEVFCQHPSHIHALPLEPRALARKCAMLAQKAAERGAKIHSLQLHIVCDGQMALLNSAFMGAPGPTNILSFPGGEGMPGILALSSDTLAREAKLYGQDPAAHALRLLAHGLGHLAGFEHGPEMDEFVEALLEGASND